MRITADTTDMEIMAPVNRAKSRLKEFAAEAVESHLLQGEDLVQRAQAVRNAETLAMAQLQHRSMLASGASQTEQLKNLLRLASRREDRYSGRMNDSIRSAQDAVADWCQDVIFQMRGA